MSLNVSRLPPDGVSARSMARAARVPLGAALRRLSKLAKAGRIRRVGRGVYAPTPPAVRDLEPTAGARRAARALAQELPGADPVIFSLGSVSRLMHNMPTREILLVAVPRHLSEAAQQTLGAHGQPSKIVRAAADMRVLLDQPGRILAAILPIAERRATVRRAGVSMPRPERALVDVLVERERHSLPVYAEDVEALAEGLLRDYPFSVSTALDYARRRNAQRRVLQLLRRVAARHEDLTPYRSVLARL